MVGHVAKLLCLIFLLGFATSVSGAEPDAGTDGNNAAPKNALTLLDDFTGRNGIGLVVGAGSGAGLSYRRYLTNSIALRAAGFLFYLPDQATLYSASLLGQFDFRRDKKFLLYAVGGFAFGSIQLPKSSSDFAVNGVFPAAGLGIEFGDHEKTGFTYQIELALTGIFLDGEYSILLPLPQFGLHYIF